MRVFGNIRNGLLAAAAISAIALAPPVSAQERARQEFNLEAQDLGEALRTVSRQSGQEIIFPADAVAGKRAPQLRGTFSADEAVRILLAGTDLVADYREDGILIRGRAQASGEIVDRPAESVEILVTGSRIRGATSPSPVIVVSHAEMANAGQSNLGDVFRSIPQNFNGGQNPGVGIGVPERNGSNIGSGSAINLRGLGQDATLTLLNGHRLAYNSAFQGIDVSAIPLAAVDRVEVVADGASALYGSDAVAGVANIILRKDFSGVSGSARFGASTDGGNEQQQYSLTGGAAWSTGGVLAAFDYSRSSAIIAGDRSYTAGLWPATTLVPPLKQYSAVISGHQALSPGLIFTIDGVYNHRDATTNYPFTAIGDYRSYGSLGTTVAESYAVSPSLRLEISREWTLSATGLYAKDDTDYQSDTYQNGVVISPVQGRYYNTTKSIEFGAEGKLFSISGEDVRLAAGAGYRTNAYDAFRARRVRQISASQDARYAFAELRLPLVAPSQQLAFARSLTLSLATRFESYPGLEDVATPKLGLVYSPTKGVSIKGSWGKSFKAPQFYQQNFLRQAALYTATAVGGSGYPAGSTVIYKLGGNLDLKPEKATTWTNTLSLEPGFLPGAMVEISYFSVDYRDRVVAPISSTANALSNPAYAPLVNRSPSQAEIITTWTGAEQAANASGAPFNAASVVAIIDGSNRNASSQKVRGIDFSARYRLGLDADRSLSMVANATYLESKQQLSSGQPVVRLAGSIFNPPHFRGRAGATYEDTSKTLSAYVNYIGGVVDDRIAVRPNVRAMTTVDFSARFVLLGERARGRNAEISFTLQNVLNAKPGTIYQPYVYATPFDSTNYSPIGRFVSIAITARY